MKKITLLFILLPLILLAQVQIGQNINGFSETDRFGISVSMSSDGNIVAIGSDFKDGNGFNSGSVSIYQNINNTWVQLGGDINGEATNDVSGRNVSLSSDGSIVAISSELNDGNGINSGSVRIYEYQGSNWVQLGSNINGEFEDDLSGRSISLSSNGNIVAISSINNNSNGQNSGHVRVYEYQGNTWVQLGSDIDGEAAFDRSGYSISLSSNGSILAIGAIGNDNNGGDSGHVRVYEYQGNTWVQLGSDINGEAAFDQSGYNTSLSSNGYILAIGAIGNDDNGGNSGHVRVYEYQNNTWTQLGNSILGEAINDQSGTSISLSSNGTIIAIGAAFNDGNGIDSGHVRIYKYESNFWSQIGNDIDGEASEDNFGSSVSLSSNGEAVAIGGFNNDVNGINSGHVRVFDLTDALSVEEFQNTVFQLYPNPTKNQFTIQLHNTSILEKVSIYNTLGQLVQASEDVIVNTSTLASGSYIVEITTNKGKASKKLIIE